MKRLAFFVFLLLCLPLVGIALGQEDTTEAFPVFTTIGRPRPQNMLYDPNYDRFVMVDSDGRLLLVDARTYQTQKVLYEQGLYSDYVLSHNGRWLALAIDKRIELWDTQSATLAAKIEELGGIIQVQGPMLFSDDDTLLEFNGIYLAPQSTRRSENDTDIIPWLWSIPAATGEGESSLPGKPIAKQFFDYRNGFVLTPGDRLISGLPRRIQVLDARSQEVVREIDSNRAEQDPLQVWFSAHDRFVYISPNNDRALVQLDPQTNNVVDLRIGQQIARNNPDVAKLSRDSRIIGKPNSLESNSLLRLLLGDDYIAQHGYHPLTVMLVDFIKPSNGTPDQMRPLLYIYDEAAGSGTLNFVQPQTLNQMILSPDGAHLLVRRTGGTEPLELYNLNTGAWERRYDSALNGLSQYINTPRAVPLAFNHNGTEIINDFQRLKTETGEVLFQDLTYTKPFDQFFFTDDSRHLVTLSGPDWQLWDVETASVLRRAQVSLNGDILATWPTGERFLTSTGSRVEVVDIAKGDRRSLTFEQLPGRSIEDVLPSPDWEHYLVVYSTNSNGPFYPGNEVALYSLAHGQEWFIAGDDLPYTGNRRYGWIDNRTAYVYGENTDGYDQPSRIYDVQYDPSGLPACLVSAFPDAVTRFADVWERQNNRLSLNGLNLLARTVCASLPNSAEGVMNILEPPPATYVPQPTTTPALVAGVPACLTANFPDRALEYAQDWRKITQGLSPEDMAKMEQYLCESLGGGEGDVSASTPSINGLTMLIDVNTGVRSTGSFNFPAADERPLGPLQDAFLKVEKRELGNAALSPDEQYLAEQNSDGLLTIYRVVVPYRQLLSTLTATANQYATAQNIIGVRPSPTPTFDALGTPRPTLTATVTPTSPPLPQSTAVQAVGDTEAICPASTLYRIENPPPAYSPVGVITGSLAGNSLWVMQPRDGYAYAEPEIPQCGAGLACQYSPNFQWILTQKAGSIVLMRPDGRDLRVLFSAQERPAWPKDLSWYATDVLQYTIRREVAHDPVYEITEVHQYDVNTGKDTVRADWPPVTVNQLSTEVVSQQPGGPMAIVRTSFNTGSGTGYKYYTYNRATGSWAYFARTNDVDAQGPYNFIWSPLGDRLYYQQLTLKQAEADGGIALVSTETFAGPPATPTAGPSPTPAAVGQQATASPFVDDTVTSSPWYVFNPATGEHAYLGIFPNGAWSQDGRYIVYGLPQPDKDSSKLAVWDSQSGQTRQYCLPETGGGGYGGPILWSPDSRYLALLAQLPRDQQEIGPHLLILDLTTGTTTDLGIDFKQPIFWIDHEAMR
jgi:WD40 repeat protein